MAADGLTESQREALSAFETGGAPGEPMTTAEVAERLGVSRRTVYGRLDRLVEKDLLATKKVGARGRVWWRPVETSADRERVRGEQQLQLSVSRSVAEAATLEEGLRTALAEVCTWTDWEVGQAWVPTGDGEVERLPASHVASAEFTHFEEASPDFTFGPGEGIPGQVLESGEPVWFPDVSAVSEDIYPRTDLAAEAGVKAGLGVPILVDDSVAAVLEFYMSDIREENERLIDAVTSVAAELGGLVAQKRAEDALAQERDLLERVMEAAPVGISVLSPDGEIERTNSRARTLHGRSEPDADPLTADYPLYDEDGELIPADERPFAEVLDTGESVHDWVAQVDHPDGGRRWLSINAAPIVTDEGEIERVITIAEDITQLKEQARRLERQRDTLESELEEIYGRITDSFYALDDQWRFTYVNDRAEELIDYRGEGLIGKNIWEVFEWGADSILEEEYRTALETQEPTSFEFYYPDPLDAWYEIHVYPSESGLSVYFRDVTERKERERELEQYETLAETASDVILTIDDESTIRNVNPAVEEIFGHAPADLVGEPLTTLMPDRLTDDHRAGIERYLRTGVRRLDWDYIELPGVRADGTEFPLAVSFSEYEYGGDHYFTGIIRDVTERKERERELRENERKFRTLAENLGEVVWMTSEDPEEFLYVNPVYEDVWGQDREALYEDGHTFLDAIHPDDRDRVREAYSGLPESDYDAEYRVVRPDGSVRWLDAEAIPIRDEDGDVTRIVGIADDVTDHKVREQELARQRSELRERERALRRAYEVIAAPDKPFPERIDDLLEVVREAVGMDYATLSRVHDDEYVFEAVDAPDDADIRAGDTVPLAATNCERVVGTEQTLVLRDIREEAPRLADREATAEWGVSCYLGAPVIVDGEVYGTFCFYDMEAKVDEFSDWEVAFVELLSNWVGNELERQRYTDRLAALNSLNEIVHEITDAVIDRSTREEIEAVVCDRLAESDSYLFAWTGEGDVNSETVTVRAESGVEGYLDETTISIDPDDEHGQGPTGRAFRTGEVQIAQEVQNDPRYEPWRDIAEKYGFRSSAAIPIVHGGTVYGVLNVYTDRPNAFEDQERAVVRQLGEVVGHAIAAVERKRALLSDDVVELEFRIQNVFEALGVEDATDGTITIDEAVPIENGEYLVYGHATADAVGSLSALVDAVPHWKEVTYQDGDGEGDGDTTFEVLLSDPPVLSALSSLGGSIEQAVFEEGDYRMTLHLSPGSDVRKVIEAVQDAYPTAKLMAQRQIERVDDPADRLDRVFAETLTDRQRAALQVAYYGGFFEWPREATGEEIAESLGVSAPTFHQHLRKAEKQVFESLLSAAT